MAKSIYFLKYNNYANRIFKRDTQLSDYLGAGNENLIQSIEKATLWNPNDGITTTIVTPTSTDFSVEPDYCVVADEYGNIDTRWFVTETVRERNGQYTCHLKRDVFAEAWDELMDATCNIDRAILSKYSPLIFNPEPISVNQILYNEYELTDDTGCPWIVFYGKEKPDPVSRAMDYSYDITVSDINDYVTANTYNYLSDNEHDIQLAMLTRPTAPPNNPVQTYLLPYGYQGSVSWSNTDSKFNWCQNPIHLVNPDGIQNFVEDFKSVFNLKGSYEAERTMANNSKIAYDTGSSKFYRITSYYTNDASYNELMASPTLLTDAKYVLANHSDIQYTSGHDINDVEAKYFRVYYVYRSMVTVATELTDATTINAQVPAGGTEPKDTPYLIWTMPYGNITVSNTVGGTTTTVTTDKDINLSIAMKFSAANSSGKLYDFQILPFCPLPDEFINSDGSVSVVDNSNITDNATLTKTVDGTTSVAGYIFSVPNASFTRQIVFQNSDWQFASNKLSSICEMWRLYSPNYASSFEFSVAKNGGLYGFNIRCTYMPINPYIRIAPIWGGLYGISGFDKDPRGLICGGDYSMARIADSWVNYQEQNKNFEAIFNREISHMDVMRNYERAEQIVGATVGSIAGGAIGGKAFGTAGAVVGAVGAVGTGIADVILGESKYRESKSYATEMHELQLGNVQAMPRTLSRTTAFNVDNRYFPILARYLPTQEEIALANDFINNRSMNVGVIGKPVDYIYNRYSKDDYTDPSDRGFIQGSIIKIDSIHDTHFVDELNMEFQKGVYLR